jgi:EmrB/QacA subfamily drug resistance transporter
MTAPIAVGFRSERGPVLISLMLSTGLVAIDSTIIATAVPSIVRDLGGFAQFPWLFSVYLLAQAVSVPIYGKLADLFGRRPIMVCGIALFFAGSVLCGFAWSMTALIAFRALQGLGAGAVQPMSLTIAGDLYSTAERGKVQGYLASVWAMSSVIGPALGGVFSEYVSWRWIFFVNVPLCLVAVVMLTRHFHENVVRRRHTLDYAGSALLGVGCSLVILGLLEGGEAWAWSSAPSICVLLVGVALIVAFVLVEQRASEPVLPLWVLRRRLLVTSSLVALGVGAVLIGLTSYVPTFVQGVVGVGPLVAGFAVATLTVGWPVTASQSGKIYMRAGFRFTALIGSAVTIVGAVLTALLTVHATIAEVAGACFVVGAGLGLVAGPTLIAAQSSVGWSERGVVTGTNMFSRSMGSALGVALFGAIANATLGYGRQTHSATELARASHHVFLAVAVLALLMGLAVVAMPTVRAAGLTPPAVPESGNADAAAGVRTATDDPLTVAADDV